LLLELLKSALSVSEVLEDNLSLVVVDLKDHVSVGSLHSESNELGDAFVCDLNTA
jgi:hypothetical protein